MPLIIIKEVVRFLDSSQVIEIKKQKHGRKFSGKIFSSPARTNLLNRKLLQAGRKISASIHGNGGLRQLALGQRRKPNRHTRILSCSRLRGKSRSFDSAPTA